MSDALLEVNGLVRHFAGRNGVVRAVDGVDFELGRGETLALVGESGCGKSTVGRSVLRLIDPTAGTIRFEGLDVATADRRTLQALRRRMQMVFQDPYASLDPHMSVQASVAEPLVIHRIGTRSERADRVSELFEVVGLDASVVRRRPREFSGGQRQRIAIARALALEPALLVCDEAVSALDVSVQAQILNLLEKLQRDRNLSYLFISHDLSVVRHVAHRVAVMYLGKIVESAACDAFFQRPRHPYSIALLSAVPEPNPVSERTRRRIVLKGEIPSSVSPPSGCHFRTRCWKAQQLCSEEQPPLRVLAAGHVAACHYPESEGE